jgi:hypothetical protein
MTSGTRYEGDESEVPPPLASDSADIAIHGGIPMEQRGVNNLSPEQLLHGGEHFDDVDRALLRQIERQETRDHGDEPLPRDILHESVMEQGLTRPTPALWLN